MRPAGRLRHLVLRFFYVARARPLSPPEQAEVAALLRPAEERLFWSQTAADQRHGLDAARHVVAAAPGRRDLARAALLHDAGKRHARLGPIGRSVATALGLVRAPVSGRLRAYLDHGPVGARELQAAGAERLVVDYTRHHHGRRPDGITPADWDLLDAADHL